MKYILSHVSKDFKKRTFKGKNSRENLEIFLSENNWSMPSIDNFIETCSHFGWELEIIPENNKDKFELLWREVEHLKDYDHDDCLYYCIENNFQALAVDQWQNSGASKYNFYAKITQKELKEERKELYKQCDTFRCEKCNHIGFYDYDENVEFVEYCYNCSDKGPHYSYRNVEKIKMQLTDICEVA